MPRLVLFSYCIAHIMSEKHPQVLGSISISDSWTIKVLWATGELFLFWREWEYRINICFLKSENSLNPLRASEVCISLKSSPLEECRVCIVGTHYINKCKKPIAFVCTTVARLILSSEKWWRRNGPEGLSSQVREREVSHWSQYRGWVLRWRHAQGLWQVFTFLWPLNPPLSSFYTYSRFSPYFPIAS